MHICETSVGAIFKVKTIPSKVYFKILYHI